MAREYPKYIKPTGNTLGYQRAIPTRLLHVSTKKLWTYPLGVPVTASETQIAVAWAKANEAFELHCRTLSNSSPAAYSESEIDRLAEEFLRRKGLQQGQFADVVNPELAADEDVRQEQLQVYPDDYDDHVITEADEVRRKLYKAGNRQPTVQEAATLRAWEAVCPSFPLERKPSGLIVLPTWPVSTLNLTELCPCQRRRGFPGASPAGSHRAGSGKNRSNLPDSRTPGVLNRQRRHRRPKSLRSHDAEQRTFTIFGLALFPSRKDHWHYWIERGILCGLQETNRRAAHPWIN